MPEQDQNTNNQTQASGEQAQQPQESIKFDEWIKSQPEPVQQAYNQHTTGLQNTVKATREERDTLNKQLKDMLPKVEKGSELEKQLSEFTAKLEESEAKSQFIEEPIKPEIGCSNPRAAFLLAKADGLFDRKGNPDWAAIRQAAPELFQKLNPKGNGGSGTQEPQNAANMNTFIRSAAGR